MLIEPGTGFVFRMWLKGIAFAAVVIDESI
jgi:hypothetical protein